MKRSLLAMFLCAGMAFGQPPVDDDVPDAGDFGALVLAGDVSSSGLTTTIGADKVLESMLKCVNTPTDEYVFTYESTTGDFEWQVDDDVPEAADYSALTAGRSLTAPSAGTIDADAELYTDTKCMTIESPATGDDFLFFRAETAITITGIDCLCADGTSVALLVKECNGNGGSCGNTEASITCGTTNTTEATSIDDAAVDAGDWMRIDPGTNTGTVTQLAVCVTFTVND